MMKQIVTNEKWVVVFTGSIHLKLVGFRVPGIKMFQDIQQVEQVTKPRPIANEKIVDLAVCGKKNGPPGSRIMWGFLG